jgi:LacI family transcriptional regulator
MTNSITGSQPTIEDVALLAGVSTATVSRALNGTSNVSSVSKHKVDLAVKTLGFIPNAGARSLMLRRSGTIGVVIPTLSNTVFSQAMHGFQQCLDKSGYQLLLACSNYNKETEANQVRNLISRGVEGIALTGGSQNREILSLLKQRGIPYLHVVTHRSPMKGYSVGFDNCKAAGLPIHHLFALGHRKIGVLVGNIKNNDRSKSRLHGMLAALQQENYHPLEIVHRECDYSIESARSSFMSMIRSFPEITAIACGNDVIAHGVVLQARHCGFSVPRDISVTGFDDIELSEHLLPSLTTVRTNAAEMWFIAAEKLLGLIDKEGLGTRHTKSPVQLIIRDSTSRPRSHSLKLKFKEVQSSHA